MMRLYHTFKKQLQWIINIPDPHNNLAITYKSIGKLDLAIETIKQGLVINPYFPEGHNNLSSFLNEKKDFKNAIFCADRAIMIRKTYGKAWYNKAMAHYNLGEKDIAYDCMKKACYDADLDTDTGFFYFAKVCIEIKKFDDALKALNKVLEINPNYPIHIYLGCTYEGLGYDHKALDMYLMVLKSSPNNVNVLYACSKIYSRLSKYDDAISMIERILNQQGIQIPVEIYEKLVNDCIKADRKKDAQFYLDKILEYKDLSIEVRAYLNGLASHLKANK